LLVSAAAIYVVVEPDDAAPVLLDVASVLLDVVGSVLVLDVAALVLSEDVN
jgi:hypothetical protein